MYFIPIVILATIYCFLDERETEIIREYNKVNPQTYIIKRKKNNKNS